MPTRENTNFPRLTSADEFESMIRDICALEWNDPYTEKFGRRGQKQYGIDVYGKPVDLDGKYRGAQCKLRKKDDQLTKSEIEAEVQEARDFPHELETLIIVTDTPRDTEVQILVDNISAREVARGGFRVVIWFWDNITERLAARPKLIIQYYHDYFATLTSLPAVERLIDTPLQIIFSGNFSLADTKQLEEALQMRGVRTLSATAGHIRIRHLDTVNPDGIVCVYEARKLELRESHLPEFVAEVLSFSRQVERSTPIFVLLPPQARVDFVKSFARLGGEILRLELLSPTLTINQKAGRILQAVFAYGYTRRGSLRIIDVMARTREAWPNSVLLDVDWQANLSTTHFPSPEEWEADFVPALIGMRKQLLSQIGGARLQFNCQLPVPAAIAVGYFFNVRVAKVGVWARQTGVSDFKQQFWLSDGSPADVPYPLTWNKRPKDNGRSAIVELTTYVSIHTAVERYAGQTGLNPDAWVQMRMEVDGASLLNIDEGHAVAYANQVGQIVRSLNAEGITDIHFFTRIPSALGLLVGQRLQACGRLHLYWFDNPTYRFAFILS